MIALQLGKHLYEYLTPAKADELLEKAWKCLDLTQQALGNH